LKNSESLKEKEKLKLPSVFLFIYIYNQTLNNYLKDINNDDSDET